MAYYLRAFCTAETVPSLSDVLQWVNKRGVPARVDPQDLPSGTPTWGEEPIRILYQEGQPTFTAEVNQRSDEESLAAQEISEFLQMLEALKKSRKRDRVVEHLHTTRFIVVCEVPTDNFGDAGFHAVDVFLAYFLVHSNGLIQADGQGFYEMGKLTVELAA